MAGDLGYWRVPKSGSVGLGIVGPAIMVFGTQDQKDRFLRPIACGEVEYCQGFSEPNVGSDLASRELRAERDGDEYVNIRVQFGRPIGTFQAVQHRWADLKGAVDSGRMLTHQAAWKLDQGMPADQEVAMAKAQSGSLSRTATQAGHSIFAGISFTVEHDMQLYSARAKIAEANLGDTEYHLDLLAAQMPARRS